MIKIIGAIKFTKNMLIIVIYLFERTKWEKKPILTKFIGIKVKIIFIQKCFSNI